MNDETTIAVIFYVSQVIIAWWLIGQTYRRLWIEEKPSEMDLVIMFMPVLNTAFCFYIILEFFLNKINKPFIQWFFRQ